eukprot:g4924.t1
MQQLGMLRGLCCLSWICLSVTPILAANAASRLSQRISQDAPLPNPLHLFSPSQASARYLSSARDFGRGSDVAVDVDVDVDVDKNSHSSARDSRRGADVNVDVDVDVDVDVVKHPLPLPRSAVAPGPADSSEKLSRSFKSAEKTSEVAKETAETLWPQVNERVKEHALSQTVSAQGDEDEDDSESTETTVTEAPMQVQEPEKKKKSRTVARVLEFSLVIIASFFIGMRCGTVFKRPAHNYHPLNDPLNGSAVTNVPSFDSNSNSSIRSEALTFKWQEDSQNLISSRSPSDSQSQLQAHWIREELSNYVLRDYQDENYAEPR